ncbi:kinase-like protein [Dichomitus squalens]|uniref:non-specific serine/threonine protein kinase n=1 Tax=Dichomitus squalens TaxID=114155 RepID=A0A4Q9NUV8_9APHY|nr:kinase-like protein [Dichomitus squalens]TBU58109.1 kinase-like protein [Dichomitus squalens]
MPSPSRNSSSNKLLNAYQLGDSLGKGAFGQVYRALNWATGETVAIKEIQLSNIPKSEIGQIMSEIDLLKNLNHPNIVKYKGFEKTPEYLYIILEFCENGSLHNICKKFGKFPETLVGVYIAQVLEGLVYLHDQGVIHRDIKGANILTNKDGCVKLADFGVASSTAAGAVRDDAVVGSPYWMAPEVIEQSGATTASDIWSVGCTVIELLEGKPPYHFLDPMPALFRIVQDDSPPIPDGASPIVKDFLYHCFQKDCNLRISAKKLLRHPWMVAARRQITNSGSAQGGGGGADKPSGDGQRTNGNGNGAGPAERRPLSNYNYDEAVLKVQEWNEALKSPSRPSKHPERNRKSSLAGRADSPLPSPTHMISSVQASSSLQAPQQSMLLTTQGRKPGSLPKPGMPAALGHIRETLPMPFILQAPEEQTDNWDDDFEEGISLTKLHALDKPPAEDEKHEADDNAQTIRPGRSPGLGTVPLPVAKAPEPQIAPIAEDYSDLLFEEDEAKLEEKVADFKMKNSVRRGLFHPNDIKTIGLQPPSPGPMTAPLPGLTHRRSRPSLSIISTGPNSGPSSARGHSRSSSFVGNDSFGREQAKRLQSDLDKYADDDDEDYEDVFGKANGPSAQPMQTLQLNTRLSNKSWLGDEDDAEDDPFAEIDEGYAEEDLEANLQRDKYARLCNQVTQLIDELTPSAPDFQLRDACDQLLSIINDTPEMQSQLVSAHGMLAILEVLESRTGRDVTLKLLQIVNALVTTDMGFLESFCLIGGIPVIMGFTSKKYPSECRLEASHFIRLLCHSSVLTLQMFISCRGLKVLVDLLDEDYTEQSELVIHALNGICSVFELQSPTTKNDFCRMFIREGLLDPLSSALLNVMAGRGEIADDMNRKILQIILVFCQVSQSDIHVRNALGTRKIVRRLLRACELLEPEYLVQMLKAVKHLSMSTNTTILEVLQNANAIEILVKILDERSSGPLGTEMANHIFQTCYNLCRLNKSRQEEAAQAGIIPSLKRVIESSSPLKQFALPILCDLASAGKSCRILLWQHDGLSLYLRLLEDPYFQVSALEAILSWLQDETARIEDELMKPESLDALLRCFVQAKANSFENLLDPLLKIFRLSTNIAIGVAKSQFFKRLIDKLGSSKAVVRLNLLRILRTVCDVHPNRAVLVERYGIYDIVAKLSKEDVAVLVRELAREIVPTLAPALKPSARLSKGVDTPKSAKAIAPKRMRRHASESLAGTPATSHGGVGASTNGSSHLRTSTRSGAGLNGHGRSSRQQLHDIPWQGQDRR